MASKPHTPDSGLIAIYRLEFYKKKKNWKLHCDETADTNTEHETNDIKDHTCELRFESSEENGYSLNKAFNITQSDVNLETKAPEKPHSPPELCHNNQRLHINEPERNQSTEKQSTQRQSNCTDRLQAFINLTNQENGTQQNYLESQNFEQVCMQMSQNYVINTENEYQRIQHLLEMQSRPIFVDQCNLAEKPLSYTETVYSIPERDWQATPQYFPERLINNVQNNCIPHPPNSFLDIRATPSLDAYENFKTERFLRTPEKILAVNWPQNQPYIWEKVENWMMGNKTSADTGYGESPELDGIYEEWQARRQRDNVSSQQRRANNWRRGLSPEYMVHLENVLNAADKRIQQYGPECESSDDETASVDSVGLFYRGAHLAPHSSETDLQKAIDEELNSNTAARLTSEQLARVTRKHCAVLRTALRELLARDEYMRAHTLSPTSDVPQKDYDNSHKAMPFNHLVITDNDQFSMRSPEFTGGRGRGRGQWKDPEPFLG